MLAYQSGRRIYTYWKLRRDVQMISYVFIRFYHFQTLRILNRFSCVIFVNFQETVVCMMMHTEWKSWSTLWLKVYNDGFGMDSYKIPWAKYSWLIREFDTAWMTHIYDHLSIPKPYFLLNSSRVAIFEYMEQ